MIRTTDLSVRFGPRLVLNGISFDVAKGESVALVGSNGSGKTTILRVLLGLVPADGYASIGGHPIRDEAVAARKLVGYLPQKPAFGDALAIEVLTFVAKLRRIDTARVHKILDEVGLAPHARERARTFSGGMQQRLSLAIALLADPPLLLLDEPTAGLDREGQRAFLDIATSLRAEGRTLLLASHRSDEIARLTDRILHLDQGRFVPPEEEAAESAGGEVINILPRMVRR